MKTKLVLKLGDGNFQEGFPNSAIEVRPNGGGGQKLNCHLPPEPDLPPTYQKWQGQYRGLAQNTQTFRAGKKKTYPAKVSIAICEKCYQELGAKINDWLNALPIIGELKEILNSQESADNQTILLEVDTQRITDPQTKYLLHQLHLELWDLFGAYQVENCLRLHEVKSDTQEIAGETRNKRVNVLGIFGDDTNINLGEDVKLINRLRSQRSHPVFLPDANGKELTRADFEALWDYRWDVVIFAGHSKTILGGKTGVIELNKNESLDFQEIKETLKEAKKLGLKLAILNSCDGLGLAEQLKGLGITVIVWREPVPDNIASQWLKYFLKEFTNTDKPDGSIYRAMWAAQQRLGEVKPKSEEDVRQKSKKERAGVTGLPVVIYNGTEEPPTWNQLRGRSGGRIGGADGSGERELSRQEFKSRRDFLKNRVKPEVKERLSASLHQQTNALINTVKEAQPEQVKRSWETEVAIGSYQKRLPPDTDIYQVFDEWTEGRLLILGEPGAGKTTTMLELARELVKDAEEDSSQPMPGLFNLSTWKNDKQSIVDWLVEQLKIKGVRKDIARKWLKNKEILPMLDGLDELEAGRQESCVEAINRWLQGKYSPPGLVVCSRIEEYEKYETRLLLNGAVRLLPLSDEQIRDYLEECGRSDFWEVIEGDEKLLEMVRKPLFLSLVMVELFDIAEWQKLDSFKERLSYLLNIYIETMVSREIKNLHYPEKKAPSPEKVKDWLSWLAGKMERETETEFLIEKMQPSWLKNRKQRLIGGFIAGLMFVLVYAPIPLLFFIIYLSANINTDASVNRLIDAIVTVYVIVTVGIALLGTLLQPLGLIGGAIGAYAWGVNTRNIKTVETIKFSGKAYIFYVKNYLVAIPKIVKQCIKKLGFVLMLTMLTMVSGLVNLLLGFILTLPAWMSILMLVLVPIVMLIWFRGPMPILENIILNLVVSTILVIGIVLAPIAGICWKFFNPNLSVEEFNLYLEQMGSAPEAILDLLSQDMLWGFLIFFFPYQSLFSLQVALNTIWMLFAIVLLPIFQLIVNSINFLFLESDDAKVKFKLHIKRIFYKLLELMPSQMQLWQISVYFVMRPIFSLTLVAIIGMFLAIILSYISTIILESIFVVALFWYLLGTVVVLITMPIWVPSWGLINAFVGGEIESKVKPNQGIWSSLHNTIYLLFTCLPLATIFLWALKLGLDKIVQFNEYWFFGSLFLLSLYLGIVAKFGLPFIEHFSLRIALYCTGKTPWNYARFLDYATERMLLQRVGGGYRFLHKYLQEHFAHNLPK